MLAIQEKHGLGTSYGSDMRIIQITSDTRQHIGKASSFASILPRELAIRSHHPANCCTCLYFICQRRKHPGTVSSHGEAHTTDAFRVNFRKCRQKISGIHVFIVHKSTPTTSQHHKVTRYSHMTVTVNPFFTPAFAPEYGINRDNHITMSRQIIAYILPTIALFSPCISIS